MLVLIKEVEKGEPDIDYVSDLSFEYLVLLVPLSILSLGTFTSFYSEVSFFVKI